MHKQGYYTILAVVFLVCCLQAEPGRAQVEEPSQQDPGFFYIIQKGDTLWDLSERFYNDRWTWPGLWKINDGIKNPHWIYPGKKIRIFLTETLEKKPPAPPLLVPDLGKKKKDSSIEHPFFAYPAMDSLGFISEKPIDALGTIIGSQDNNLMMATGDTIYIKPGKDSFLVSGHDYRIISTEPVSVNFNGERFKGVKHIIRGIVTVIDVDETYTTARITRSFDHAAAGNIIAPFEPSSGKIAVETSPDAIGARILCSLADDIVLSEHKIAFINQGSDHGIKPGQTYTLFEEREKINDPDGIPDTIRIKDRAMGKIIVLHAEKTASTVLVLSCSNEFSAGTLVN